MWIPSPAAECSAAEIAAGPIFSQNCAYIGAGGQTGHRPQREGEHAAGTIGGRAIKFLGLYNKWNPQLLVAGFESPYAAAVR